MIVSAAIRMPNGRVWSVPRPGRHPDIIRQYARETGERLPSGHVQGFLTDGGAFLDREAALGHARAMRQLMRPALLGSVLTSEDLW